MNTDPLMHRFDATQQPAPADAEYEALQRFLAVRIKERASDQEIVRIIERLNELAGAKC